MIEIVERAPVELVRRYPDGPPGGWRRGLRGSVGGGADNRLLRFSDGVPTRGSAGSYLAGGPGVVAWAGENELRYEDRGDGNGPVALFEGPSTNLVIAPEDINATDWFLPAQAVVPGDILAPDGELDAKVVEILTGADRSAEQFFPTGVADGGVYTGSIWARDVSGDFAEWLVRAQGKDGAAIGAIAAPIIPAWRRGDLTINVGTNALEGTSLEARTQGNTTAAARWGLWGAQFEQLPFPSSYIDDVRIPGRTRAQDYLTFTAGQVPSEMYADVWEIDCYPYFNATDTQNATFYYVYSFESGAGVDGILFQENTARVRVVCGGTTTTITGLVTANRHQKVTMRVDAAAQEITFSGLTAGDGTYAFGGGGFSGGVRVGARWAGAASPFYGRISEPRAVA